MVLAVGKSADVHEKTHEKAFRYCTSAERWCDSRFQRCRADDQGTDQAGLSKNPCFLQAGE